MRVRVGQVEEKRLCTRAREDALLRTLRVTQSEVADLGGLLDERLVRIEKARPRVDERERGGEPENGQRPEQRRHGRAQPPPRQRLERPRSERQHEQRQQDHVGRVARGDKFKERGVRVLLVARSARLHVGDWHSPVRLKAVARGQAGRISRASEVPLADHARLVASLLQRLRNGRLVCGQASRAEAHDVEIGFGRGHANADGVAAGEQRSARRRANRRCHQVLRQHGSRSCEGIQPGCLHRGIPGESDVAIANVVAPEEKHVGLGCRDGHGEQRQYDHNHANLLPDVSPRCLPCA